MSVAQRMPFLQDVFQMTAIAFVSVINHYHINGLPLFWDILYYKYYSFLNHKDILNFHLIDTWKSIFM